MLCESIWIDRPKYEEAEAHYQRFLSGAVGGSHGLEKKVIKIYFSQNKSSFKLLIMPVHKESIRHKMCFSNLSQFSLSRLRRQNVVIVEAKCIKIIFCTRAHLHVYIA